MYFADRFRIAKGESSILVVEILGKVVKRFEMAFQDYGSVE